MRLVATQGNLMLASVRVAVLLRLEAGSAPTALATQQVFLRWLMKGLTMPRRLVPAAAMRERPGAGQILAMPPVSPRWLAATLEHRVLAAAMQVFHRCPAARMVAQGRLAQVASWVAALAAELPKLLQAILARRRSRKLKETFSSTNQTTSKSGATRSSTRITCTRT